MIIFGGERPVITNPDPNFGDFLDSLNKLRMSLEDKLGDSDKSKTEDLNYLATAVDTLMAKCGNAVNVHIAKKGALHGETAKTVGLEKVDNFRTATTQDHLNYVDNAFCTPAGVNAAVAKTVIGFNADNFQQNIRMPFAMLHHIDQFKRADKDPWTVPYFKKGPATVIMNGDRVIVSPQYPGGFAGPYSMFYSDSVKMLNAVGLNEERQLANYYIGTGWNMKGAKNIDGDVGIFRPLANKGIYDYASSLPGSGNSFVVLSSTFGDITHKGCLLSCAWVNNQIQLSHYFFGVNNPETDPTLAQIVNTSYKAVYNTVNMNNVTDAIQKTRTISLNDIFALGAGVKVESLLAAGQHPTISADWRYLNTEFLMNISIPVKVTIGTQVFNKIFTFTEAIRPGKLVISDVGAVTLLKTFSKDSITTAADLNNSKWLINNDTSNLLNMIESPGVVNTNGLVINAFTTRTSLRLKLTQTEVAGVIPILEEPGKYFPIKESINQIFVPARHMSFGDLAERVIPISQDNNQTIFLTFALAVDKSKYRYKELVWQSGTIATLDSTTNQYWVKRPDTISERDIDGDLPKSIMALTTPTGGVALSAMNFTKANDFKGRSSFSYLNGSVSVGSEVTLSTISEMLLGTIGIKVMERSKLSPAYGGKPELYPQSASYGVFTITSDKALVYWSDGVSYVEAIIVPYTLTAGVITLNLKLNTPLFVVSKNTSAKQGKRKSSSADDLFSEHCDLMVYKTSDNGYRFVLNHPFEELAGDVSFTTTTFTGANPVLTAESTWSAETYSGNAFFDIAEEHYPVVMLPKVGIFQQNVVSDNATTMTRIGGTEKFDPYKAGNNKVIIIPEGYRVVINGIGVMIDETQELIYTTFPRYFYLEENSGVIELKDYATQQQPNNNAVMVGYDPNGTGVIYTRSYIVVDKHLISDVRKGSTIPLVPNDGTDRGATSYFLTRDVS